MTVQSDVAQLSASVKSSQARAGYRMHEIQLPGGTLLREFVAPDGNVFAVAWNGPTPPNLRQALGKYFDDMVSAPKPKIADHQHLQIQPDTLVSIGCVPILEGLSGRASFA